MVKYRRYYVHGGIYFFYSRLARPSIELVSEILSAITPSDEENPGDNAL